MHQLVKGGEARIQRNAVNTFYSDNVKPNIEVTISGTPSSDGYQYTDWGSWDGTGKTIPAFSNKDAERGYYVIGRSTAVDDVPRSGTATYNGEALGIAFNGETIRGSVELFANFNNKEISGSFDLERNDGTPWVELSTGAMAYRLDDGRNFEITFSNNGLGTVKTPGGVTIVGAGNNVRGAFFGKSGEEVAGDWAVYNVPDAVGGADGVFRAKK